MKIQTKDLKGKALDWAVAQCEGIKLSQASFSYQLRKYDCLQLQHGGGYAPSTRPAQAWPIIERVGIDIHQYKRRLYELVTYHKGDENRPEYEMVARHTIYGPSRYTKRAAAIGPNHLKWMARLSEDYHPFGWTPADFMSDTPLQAAMRCYVASKLGAIVEIPEELAQ